MQCPNCNHEVTDEDGHCPECGTDFNDELPIGWNLEHGGYIEDGIEYDAEGAMLGEYEDYVPAIKQAVQDAIYNGDFKHADDLCNEHGFDKLEFEWH